MVRQAWLAYCRQSGVDPTRRHDHENWYREQLWTYAGIRTTRQAAAHHYTLLMHRFTLLSEQGDQVSLDGVSDRQNKFFRDLAEKAWIEVSRHRGTDLDFSSWLDAELAACRVADRRVHDRVHQFDEILSHFAVLSGNARLIGRFSECAERRLRYLITRQLLSIGETRGEVLGWNYARAIYRHMKLPLTMEEADASWLWKVYQALDTHSRRLQRGCRAAL